MKKLSLIIAAVMMTSAAFVTSSYVTSSYAQNANPKNEAAPARQSGLTEHQDAAVQQHLKQHAQALKQYLTEEQYDQVMAKIRSDLDKSTTKAGDKADRPNKENKNDKKGGKNPSTERPNAPQQIDSTAADSTAATCPLQRGTPRFNCNQNRASVADIETAPVMKKNQNARRMAANENFNTDRSTQKDGQFNEANAQNQQDFVCPLGNSPCSQRGFANNNGGQRRCGQGFCAPCVSANDYCPMQRGGQYGRGYARNQQDTYCPLGNTPRRGQCGFANNNGGQRRCGQGFCAPCVSANDYCPMQRGGQYGRGYARNQQDTYCPLGNTPRRGQRSFANNNGNGNNRGFATNNRHSNRINQNGYNN